MGTADASQFPAALQLLQLDRDADAQNQQQGGELQAQPPQQHRCEVELLKPAPFHPDARRHQQQHHQHDGDDHADWIPGAARQGHGQRLVSSSDLASCSIPDTQGRD